MQGNYYHWYKEHGICTNCAKNEAAPGHVMCDDCLEKKRIEHKQKRDALGQAGKDARTAYNERHRQERLASGMCPRCGRPLFPDKRLCHECLVKNRHRGQRFRDEHPRTLKESWKQQGLCIKCGAPRAKGSYFCEAHYKNALENIKKAKDASRWSNEYFHKKYFTAD